MRIVQIQEAKASIASDIRNAYIANPYSGRAIRAPL